MRTNENHFANEYGNIVSRGRCVQSNFYDEITCQPSTRDILVVTLLFVEFTDDRYRPEKRRNFESFWHEACESLAFYSTLFLAELSSRGFHGVRNARRAQTFPLVHCLQITDCTMRTSWLVGRCVCRDPVGYCLRFKSFFRIHAHFPSNETVNYFVGRASPENGKRYF